MNQIGDHKTSIVHDMAHYAHLQRNDIALPLDPLEFLHSFISHIAVVQDGMPNPPGVWHTGRRLTCSCDNTTLTAT